mmetsp:Transcript_3401/g.8184  ORF Transcript_3401/g.8184 Transcript_3401/m.8184 type:complete len:85 (-) Transcript_3401:34-288(-)
MGFNEHHDKFLTQRDVRDLVADALLTHFEMVFYNEALLLDDNYEQQSSLKLDGTQLVPLAEETDERTARACGRTTWTPCSPPRS